MAETKVKAKQKARMEQWDRAVRAVWQATRRDLDWSQEQLAEKLGWSRDTAANVESGRKRVYTSELMLFASVTGVPLETLVRRVNEW